MLLRDRLDDRAPRLRQRRGGDRLSPLPAALHLARARRHAHGVHRLGRARAALPRGRGAGARAGRVDQQPLAGVRPERARSSCSSRRSWRRSSTAASAFACSASSGRLWPWVERRSSSRSRTGSSRPFPRSGSSPSGSRGCAGEARASGPGSSPTGRTTSPASSAALAPHARLRVSDSRLLCTQCRRARPRGRTRRPCLRGRRRRGDAHARRFARHRALQPPGHVHGRALARAGRRPRRDLLDGERRARRLDRDAGATGRTAVSLAVRRGGQYTARRPAHALHERRLAARRAPDRFRS